MMNTFLKFPDSFIWGAATASYQIEGAVLEDGRTPSIWDTFSHTAGKVRNGDNGDIACDHYHRMESDVKLMREMGLKAYRFSISWSRVLPQGRGEKNQIGIDFYSRLVDQLLKNDITPFGTLYHWDLPMALQDAGGWLNRRIVDWFIEYAQLMYNVLGDRVKVWSTHNEPNVSTYLGYCTGLHAPGVKDLSTYLQAAHHVLLSHGGAVCAGRAVLPDAKFGIVPAISQMYPEHENFQDQAAVEQMWNIGPGYFLDALLKGSYPEVSDFKGLNSPIVLEGDMEKIAVPIDYIGINHYFSDWFTMGSDGKCKKVHKSLPTNDRGWIIYPDGMKDMLLSFKSKYGKVPIYIMENGTSFPDTLAPDGCIYDTERKEYYKRYICALHDAIRLGVDVRGYFAWSFMDNFEWEDGYTKRFGIVYVDFMNQKRIVKQSGKFYSNVIRDNGCTRDHVL